MKTYRSKGQSRRETKKSIILKEIIQKNYSIQVIHIDFKDRMHKDNLNLPEAPDKLKNLNSIIQAIIKEDFSRLLNTEKKLLIEGMCRSLPG